MDEPIDDRARASASLPLALSASLASLCVIQFVPAKSLAEFLPLRRDACFNEPRCAMVEEIEPSPTPARRGGRLRFRMKVLIAGIVGGGTLIAFPATSAFVVIYIAATIAAIGVMAWAGFLALGGAMAALLIVPLVLLFTIAGVIAFVRWMIRRGSPRLVVDEHTQRKEFAESERIKTMDESLADWETDGGLVAPARLQSVWRRIRVIPRRRVSSFERKDNS